MNDCKFCAMIAEGQLSRHLPNLVAETNRAVVALNRRPAAPGHLTLILKQHRMHTSELSDDDFIGFGSLIGNLSALLEIRYNPARIIFLGDGKRSAHLHFHLIPEPTGAVLDLGAVMTDLNLANRPATLSDADMTKAVHSLREAFTQ